MEPKHFLNNKVSQVVGCRITEGYKFGLELELEGRGVRLEDVPTRGWTRHNDGSLRGDSIEFCTTGAKDYEETKKLVTDLFKKLKDHNVKFNDSIRTSTHVHLNFADKPVKQMINFFSLFTLLEEVLQYYSGEDRKGNLFCISTREAEGIMGVLLHAVGRGDLSSFAGDRYKYAACNLSSLYKFGTVEVRTMKGATSAEMVNKWVDILNDLYHYACNKMISPAELVKNVSLLGADGLMRSVFKPENYRELMLHFPAAANLHYSLMEGARVIQVFAYNFEEDFTAVVEIEEPVVRKKGKGEAYPRLINRGPHFGELYGVHRPDGLKWHCDTPNGEAFWMHGMVVEDEPRLSFNAVEERFIWTDNLGNRTPCKWWRHHDIPDEEALPGGRPLRPARFVEDDDEENEEEDWRVDFDEDDDEED